MFKYNKYIGYRNIQKSDIVNETNLIENNISNVAQYSYADLNKKYNNIFKYILIFTNNKNREENKTLNNIYDAIDNLKKANCKIIPELYVFSAAKCVYDEDNDTIYISDYDTELIIEQQNNSNTIVFARLSIQDNENCEYIIKVLQDRGFLILNPLKYSEIASNKYETAKLLEKSNIKQPKYCLITKSYLYDKKKYEQLLQNIYPEFSIKKDNEKLEFVLKILDGHGGVGVIACNGKQIYSILQMIFAIDSERSILIQEKLQSINGDIRVHVLTLRTHQIILGVMQRNTIKNDFRSNVSLGASTQKITLTKEQEQLALQAAKISRLPWCAVDIMPIIKNGKNDNVILELNSSPGTDGISNTLNYNFINLLLNNLTNPSEFILQNKLAGVQEKIIINFTDDIQQVYLAKLDTGNSAKASIIEVGDYTWDKDKEIIRFKINNIELKFDVIDISTVKTMSTANANETSNKERPIIKIKSLQLGKRIIENPLIAIIAERKELSTNALINTDILSKLGYIIDPINTHLLTKKIDKLKIL